MDLESTESWDVVTDAAVHDVSWIPGTDDDIIYLKSCKKGKTEVCVTKGAKLAAREHVKILELDAPVANLKLKKLEDHDVAFVVTGLVGDQGSLYNEEAHKEKSSGRVYDTVNIRQVSVPITIIVEESNDISGRSITTARDIPYGTTLSVGNMGNGNYQGTFTALSMLITWKPLSTCTTRLIP